MVRAVAVTQTGLYSDATAAAVGIKRTSIRSALDGLRDKADVIDGPEDRPQLTDPLFDLWLRERGLAPDAGDESDAADADRSGG